MSYVVEEAMRDGSLEDVGEMGKVLAGGEKKELYSCDLSDIDVTRKYPGAFAFTLNLEVGIGCPCPNILSINITLSSTHWGNEEVLI